MGALGLLALFIRVNFSLICNTPRDGVFPDRVKIKITISGNPNGLTTDPFLRRSTSPRAITADRQAPSLVSTLACSGAGAAL
jgi:hypothetical protein